MRPILPVILGGLLLLSACDTAVEPDLARNAPPRVSELTFSPDTIEATSQGSPLEVDLEVAVTASDAEGDLDRVRYAVLSPVRGADPVAEGALETTGAGSYGIRTTVQIPAGAIGRYTLLVYAVDAAEQISNEVRGGLIIGGEGEPPVIEDVIAPEQINPPTELRFVVVVSDPDGLQNVAQVLVRTPNNNVFGLLDDGESSGDETAGDGRYTATFEVPDSVPPSTQTFLFHAEDRFGLSSDTVAVDVTVVD